ncbi:hypothetical protein [Burkholderia cenocepacia]|uniref:hypothetical protein n=1 Tax=Burkholderia cenocepacia TaxID=95486 RepID=UPI00158EFC55|nr:hypothetical protein [Burkholderia cenocepacia]
MTITNAEIAARLADRFAMTANDELVRLYPDDTGGFVDGNFDSWQVGTSFSLSAATDTYTADMWVCNAGTGGAATVSQDTPAVGTEIAAMTRGRKYRLKYQQTTNATASPTIGQKLEGVQQYNGQSVTVQGVFAAAAAATLVVGVQATQNFGTGGSPSSSVVTSKTVAWAIGTTEAKFSVRLDIPSISGKTLGTNGNDFVRIDLLLATGATFTLYSSQIQIDVANSTASGDTTGAGGTPMPFRYRGLGLELTRVYRYVVASTMPTGYAWASATAAGFFITLPAVMRKAPAGSITSGPTYSNTSALAVSTTYPNYAQFTFNSSAAGGYFYGWTTLFDARL